LNTCYCTIITNITINGIHVKVRVDSGCRKVLLPEKVFRKIQRRSVLKKTKVQLRPFGVDAEIEVIGRACINLTVVGGKSITEWIYVGHKTGTPRS